MLTATNRRAAVGADLFRGPRQSFFGRIRDGSAVFVEMKFSFEERAATTLLIQASATGRHEPDALALVAEPRVVEPLPTLALAFVLAARWSDQSEEDRDVV